MAASFALARLLTAWAGVDKVAAMDVPNDGPSLRRIWLARGLAVLVDLLQIALFPAFVGGFVEPPDAIVDVITAVAMIGLLGWHIAFLPSFIVKTLPFADLAPTWTVAVLIATRGTPILPGKSAVPKEEPGAPAKHDQLV
jgi:hypothetical protein